jgi:hypothetical protein
MNIFACINQTFYSSGGFKPTGEGAGLDKASRLTGKI